MRPWFALAMSPLILATACVAAASTPSATISIPLGAVLAGRESVGGLCPDGLCASTFVVHADGSWKASASDGVVTTGSLSTPALRDLVAATETTLIAMAPVFTGTCPTAYDGAEVIYTWTSPDNITHRVSACDRAIPDDDPLVRALAGAEAALTP